MGGAGGYSNGILTLGPDAPEFSTFYVYVGSSGLIDDGNGGFNGGGAVGSAVWVNGTSITRRYAGGGATDIRTIKGEETRLISIDYYTNFFGPISSLKSRIIVAGGGGGSNSGGYGVGDEEGPLSITEDATSGSQTSGGRTHKGETNGENGGFGYGGFTYNSGLGISGGGGGYYGGGGSTDAFGGSGFVNKTILRNAKTISGNQKFPSPYKHSDEKGHHGDGCARITYLDSLSLCTCRNTKLNRIPVFIMILISFS